jgi:hypothetical protein
MSIQDQLAVISKTAWNILFNHIERDRIKTFKNMAYWQKLGQEQFRDICRIFPHLKISNNGKIQAVHYEKNHPNHDQLFHNDCTTIENRIAWEMNEYDYPISVSQVEKFCKYFELDPRPMLREASSDEQYWQWVNEEAQRYAW